jgi:SOS-response transcriptional repressor LexA
MTQPLTAKQHEILTYLRQFHARERLMPSFTEIAQHFGYQSLATVHEHLHNLEVKGFIRRYPEQARGIKLLEESSSNADDIILGATRAADARSMLQLGGHSVPLADVVKAIKAWAA